MLHGRFSTLLNSLLQYFHVTIKLGVDTVKVCDQSGLKLAILFNHRMMSSLLL